MGTTVMRSPQRRATHMTRFHSAVPSAPVPVPSVFWGPSHTVRGPDFSGARPYLEGASVLSTARSGALGACVPGGRLVVTRSVVLWDVSWPARASPSQVSAACAAHPTASLGVAPSSRAGWSLAVCSARAPVGGAHRNSRLADWWGPLVSRWSGASGGRSSTATSNRVLRS